MELFIPGVLLFLVSLLITFLIAPKTTPMVAILLSIIFLAFGVREHYQLFASEYRLSTWQDTIQVYAPAIIITTVILFLLYSVLAFFTGGQVPVPPLPALPALTNASESILDTWNDVRNSVKTNSIAKSANQMINHTTNAVNHATNYAINHVNDAITNATNTVMNTTNAITNGTLMNGTNNRTNKNRPPSIIETI
jgi:hypothetical protein